MSDENSGGNAPGQKATGHSRARRGPVTLDQKPLSVTVEPASETPTDEAPASGPADIRPEEVPATALDPADAGAKPVEEAIPAETAATDATAADTTSADTTPADASPADIPPAPPPEVHEEAAAEPLPPPPARSGALVVALLAGGIAGAAVSAALPFLLNPQADVEQRIAALEHSAIASVTRTDLQAAAEDAARQATGASAAVTARVTALEERLAGLAGGSSATPQADETATAAIDEMRAEIGNLKQALAAAQADAAETGRKLADAAGRIDGVVDTVAGLDPARVRQVLDERAGLNDRLGGIEDTVRRTLGQVDLGRLATAADMQAGEIARLVTRVTATEGAVAETGRRAQAAEAAGGERVTVVARLAVLERARAALARGQAFPAEVDTLARLGAAASSLAPLSAAAGGLALPASLAGAFTQAAAGFAVEALPADAGIVDRLAASASRIVRIRPVDGEPDAADIAGQVEAALRRNDATAALAAWRRLPEGARAQTGALAEALQKRVDAETALAALTEAQVRALETLSAAGQGG